MKQKITTFSKLILLFSIIPLFSVFSQNSFAPLTNGVSGSIHCSVIFNNELVVGGDFITADGNTVNRIARWNGTTWSGFGTGMDNTVRDLIVYNNELYACGSFITAGGVTVNRIARWTGSAWATLGLGLSSTGYAMESYSGSLYVGGSFLTAGGVSASRIARWNGGWSAVGAGFNNTVFALAAYNNQLIIGGLFTSIGGIPVARIATWDGSNYSTLSTGMSSGQINTLYVTNNTLYAGGSFNNAGAVPASKIASWNGTAWATLGSGMNSDVMAIQSYLGVLYAGGNFTVAGGAPAINIASWSGSAWNAIGNANSIVRNLNTYRSTLIAAGDFTQAGSINANRIAMYGAIPIAPTLVSPANNAMNVTLTPTLDWADLPNGYSYGVQVSTDPNFGSTLINVSNLLISQYTVPAGLLNLNTTYFWRANATNGMGTGVYSPIWFFRSVITNLNNISATVPGEFKLYTNYPNPFNPVTKIKFDIPEKQNVRLSVIDAAGREVSLLANASLTPGTYEYIFDASTFTSGIYFCRIQSEKYSDLIKMSLIK